MTAVKTRLKYGFMAKVEAAYGSPETLAGATDGVLVAERPDVEMPFINDGTRGRSPSGGGKLRSALPSGRGWECPVQMEAVGAAAAYAAGVVPPGIHTLLRACGMTPTGAFGVGVESWTYDPEDDPAAFDSITAEAYVNGQKYPGEGIYGSFSVTVDGPGIPLWDFDLKGRGTAAPTDAAVPAITYPAATNLPPKAVSIGLEIGLFTAGIVRGFTFSYNRDLSQRANDNSTGHGGFTPGDRDAQLEVIVEQVALTTSDPWNAAATLNPYQLKENKTAIAVTLTVGSVQYKKWTINLPQAEVTDVVDGEDGATSIWTITLAARVSSGGAADDFNIVFD